MTKTKRQVMKIIKRIFIFSILSILTQIGGIIYLINFLFYRMINRKTSSKVRAQIYTSISFVALYFMAVLIVVPLLARPLGRSALPIVLKKHVKPLNLAACLMNRHYVKPELLELIYTTADQINEIHPGTELYYLDANFPFFNKFPLAPHLSHNDGKKVDFAFIYDDVTTNRQTSNYPILIGYGVCEKPKDNEFNTTADCEEKGYWQYGLMAKLMPQGKRDRFEFSVKKNRDLISLFADNKAVGKIFIEPHIKARLGLINGKVRFHGCNSVRHDDHIHVQIN